MRNLKNLNGGKEFAPAARILRFCGCWFENADWPLLIFSQPHLP
jgi:hypothetical protein